MRSLVAATLTVLALSASALYAQPEPGEQTGKEFGTIVKTAITTALPAIGPLVEAIWPNRSENKKNTLKKELEAQKATLQKHFAAAAQTKLSPIGDFSGQLGTVLKFLNPSIEAHQAVIRMSTRLSGSENPSDSDWISVDEDFKVASDFLQLLKKVEDPELEKLSSYFLYDKLQKIRQSNLDLLSLLESSIKQRKRQQSLERLGRLSTRLGGVNDAAGYLIAEMRSGLKELGNWADGAAGSENDDLKKIFVARLEAAFPE